MPPLLLPACSSHPFDVAATYSSPLVLCLPSPERPWTADEMTVGKVYAALMIFDFYKQNKNSREQVHQPPGGLCQVLSQRLLLPALALGQLPPEPRAEGLGASPGTA